MNANTDHDFPNYRHDYSFGNPKLYDICSRTIRGVRALMVLVDYLGAEKLSRCKVLDIGCSAGIIDSVIASHVRTLTGIDTDRTAIAYAGSHNRHTNARYSVGDGTDIPFKDASFDCIICSQTYDHVKNSEKLFSEMYRVLKPGGICYVSGPNKWFPVDAHNKLWFISWMTQKGADRYLHLAKINTLPYEMPKSYWQLKRELRKFHIIDYTPKILRHHDKYCYNVPYILFWVSPIAKYIMPTFIWILQK